MEVKPRKLRQATQEELEEAAKSFDHIEEEQPLEEQDLILDYIMPARSLAMDAGKTILNKGGGMAVRSMLERIRKEGPPSRKTPDPVAIEGGFSYPSKPPLKEGITLDYSQWAKKVGRAKGDDFDYASGFPTAKK